MVESTKISHGAYSVPVLMYHHISQKSDFLTVKLAHFERQIKSLAQAGFTSLTADQFAAHLAGKTVPPKSILITFDDGYLDNWVYAHPILARYGMNAILFLVTGWLRNGPVRAHFGQDCEMPITPDHDESKQLIAQGQSDAAILRWSEIHEMCKAKTFEIHSHTHTHTRWDKIYLNNVAEKRIALAKEMDDSKLTLIQELGTVGQHLCWPQGYFDDDYLEAARAAGFHYFYTTLPYGQNTTGANPERIFRFAVRNRSQFWLRWRIWIASHPIWGPSYHNFKIWKKNLKLSYP